MDPQKRISRREFLQAGSLGLGAAFLAACAGPAEQIPPTPLPTRIPDPTPTPNPDPHAIVGDVLDFQLTGDWPGRFGSVTFRLNEGYYAGDRAYFIRTDASDITFAEENGLVWVPKLGIAERAPESASDIYLFNGGHPDQLPILSSVPSREDFSSLYRIHRVTPSAAETLFDSVEQLQGAETAGDVTIETPGIYVNYPVVKWPGGELTVDEAKETYLGTGQLIQPVDTSQMTVTFKLHECYPGSRYIVTDTSAAPMAPMMSISAAPSTGQLIGDGYDATDKIWVFANGIPGSGVMGFQPAIFAHQAGDPVWSPFWNHFTLRWSEDASARVLESAADIRSALEAGELEEFNGTPDTHPTGFIVNCPVPVLAPNAFTS